LPKLGRGYLSRVNKVN